jgi:Fe-S cluster biogenesis protein NfuA
MTEQSAEDLDRRVVSLNRVMSVHKGGVEVIASEDGNVVVGFRGMCTGCTYRPVCAETLVRPALSSLGNVTDIQILGTRINEENRLALVESLRA